MFNKLFSGPKQKLNPSQPFIALEHGHYVPSETIELTYKNYYEKLESVNRAVNMIVDDCSDIKFDLSDKISNGSRLKPKDFINIINRRPNPFQDRNAFWRDVYIDLLLDGNAFIYFDEDEGSFYRLPAKNVTIKTSEKEYIEYFSYLEIQKYPPEEIIHIKDNNISSGYRGTSRLKAIKGSMARLKAMIDFQDNFFKNGAVPGLVLKNENPLSEKIKERMIEGWLRAYSPNNGGRRPLILDGGMELDKISNVNFRELDFENSVVSIEKSIYKSLGIPPVLVDGGNNANIRPNHRLYYLETVLPMVNKLISALETFSGFTIVPVLTDIPAMQPELKEQSAYVVSLVNGGIITPNEAREMLNKEASKDEGMDEIRVPANIAGSATNPDTGGRPSKEEDE